MIVCVVFFLKVFQTFTRADTPSRFTSDSSLHIYLILLDTLMICLLDAVNKECSCKCVMQMRSFEECSVGSIFIFTEILVSV